MRRRLLGTTTKTATMAAWVVAIVAMAAAVIVPNGAVGASAATIGSPAAPPPPAETPAASAPCARPPAALGKYQPSPPGRELPAAPWVGESGFERQVPELRGKGLVLNFWATWCAPCVREMPSLDRLAAEAGARGFRVLALSADREGAPIVRKFYGVNGIGRLSVAVDKTSRVARAVGVSGLPTTVLYDAGGQEFGRVQGVAEWDAPEVVEFLASCLGARG